MRPDYRNSFSDDEKPRFLHGRLKTSFGLRKLKGPGQCRWTQWLMGAIRKAGATCVIAMNLDGVIVPELNASARELLDERFGDNARFEIALVPQYD